MIQRNVFKDGKKHILTFSYDDGNENDERLIKLFNKYGVKGTFHINGWRYANADRKVIERARKLYKGHEISCHTYSHGSMTMLTNTALVNEVMNDRKSLERLSGYTVNGMSYPSGDYDERVKSIISGCDIVYSRTTKSTNEFALPSDFLSWHPTCHHRDAANISEKFLKEIDSQWTRPLLYIWGHSSEFETEEEWEKMERLVSSLSGNSKIWYATNMEIYEYVKASENLKISVDEKIIYNPSGIDVYIEKDKSEIIKIGARQTVHI